MTGESMYAMYRLLAIAKYEERYVIPTAHYEQAHELTEVGAGLVLAPNAVRLLRRVGAMDRLATQLHGPRE